MSVQNVNAVQVTEEQLRDLRERLERVREKHFRKEQHKGLLAGETGEAQS